LAENYINIENLSVQIGTHVILKHINLSVPSGSFVSIVGPNGGGKSTLIKVILGLIAPTEGNVLIDYKPLSSLDSKYFGYVPQIKTADRSFPAMPIELVASGLNSGWGGRINKKSKKILLEILESVGAGHLAYRQLSKLSGGEMQRIYLARSIVRNPKILILDEPATGIDSSFEKDIYKLIEDFRQRTKATVIMVTHDWETAYHHSDYVLILNREVIIYDKPEIAFNESAMRTAFGHIGHKHQMMFGFRKS